MGVTAKALEGSGKKQNHPVRPTSKTSVSHAKLPPTVVCMNRAISERALPVLLIKLLYPSCL